LGISQSIKGSDRAQYVYSWHYANYISPFTEKNVEYYQDNRVDNRGNISTLSFSLSVRPIQALHLGLNINLWDEDARGKWWNRNETISYTPYNESGVDFFSNEYIERFDHGTNFDFGLLLKLQKLSFGAVYRTSFKANFFRWDRWTWDQGTSVSRDEWQYDATLHWPESYALGLCVRPSDALTVSLDYNRANWSAGKVIVDDTLEEIGYPNYAPRDTQQLRAGVEYLVSRSRLAVPLRLGGFINEVFWSDWEDKPIRYYGFTCGAGLALKSITLDLAAIYSIGKYREVYVYANEIPYYDKVKEMDWEILLSITYRLW